VALNVQAFRRGRQAIADPEAFEALVRTREARPRNPLTLSPEQQRVADAVRAPADGELARLVRIRVAELTDYHSLAYATRYVEGIERARAVEAERTPGHSELAEAVAFSLHKLMAYKDEYEVARLHLDPQLRAEIETEFGEGARYSYRLHPPMLRALGYTNKIELGAWFDPAFRALRRMRRLRGTALDPFGRAEVRRVERELIEEFEALIGELVRKLSPANHAVAVELARTPDMVRGYEEIKLGNVASYRERIATLRPQLDDDVPALEVVRAGA
jgi:indolepyruvate ferredoxin oxidoreductase